MSLLWLIGLAVVAQWAWTARHDARRAREHARQLQGELAVMEAALADLQRQPTAAQTAGAVPPLASPVVAPVMPAAPPVATPDAPPPAILPVEPRAADREPLVARTAIPPAPAVPARPAEP